MLPFPMKFAVCSAEPVNLIPFVSGAVPLLSPCLCSTVLRSSLSPIPLFC